MKKKSKALSGNEVVVHVPRGGKRHVKVVETSGSDAEITVRVAKDRKAKAKPLLGVIVK